MKRILYSAVFLLLFIPLYICAQDSLNTAGTDSIQQESTIKPENVENKDGQSQNEQQISDDVKNKENGFTLKDSILIGIALFGVSFGVYQYRKRISDTALKKEVELKVQDKFEQTKQDIKTKTDEDRYLGALEEELGKIRILGSPDIDSMPVKLVDTFVPLQISTTFRTEQRFDSEQLKNEQNEDRTLTPEEVIQRAFKKNRMLLIVGDPGSGKTTLLKYYAMCCMKNEHYKELGFTKPVFICYLPLRELIQQNDEFEPLHINLSHWAKRHSLEITPHVFYDWLQNRDTLVLLDGLDEVSDLKLRKKVCEWIDHTCMGLHKARFVVTSRWTGIRKIDGIELTADHLRADVKDFKAEQQEDFLHKWFKAAFIRDSCPEQENENTWIEQQKKKAEQRAKTVIDFLKKPENESLQQLVVVPMLLQIIAIIWKERDFLPDSRAKLYDAALNYLLEFRDRRRDIYPVLPSDKARRVLSPVSLWMQEELQQDNAPKKTVHDKMKEKLKTFKENPAAEEFCQNLVYRAGLLAEYGDTDYIFRHKSFREYMAGVQLADEAGQTGRIENLVGHFGLDWWEEPIRFFMSRANENIFDMFMKELFSSDVSNELSQKQQNLLQTIIRESPQHKIDALVTKLNDPETNINRLRYILECLKTIGTQEALDAVRKFNEKGQTEKEILSYAKDILGEAVSDETTKSQEEGIHKESRVQNRSRVPKDSKNLPATFRFGLEDNAQYILIKGGSFKYSVSKKVENVGDIYFAKYPVTNKLYRRFIRYLSEKEKEYTELLPVSVYTEKLSEFAETIKSSIDKTSFTEYLVKNYEKWPDLLESKYDDEKRFNQDEQPVVGITWYAARAYCFWLSMLDFARQNSNDFHDIHHYMNSLRLPTELEWEWAAAGREADGSLREYPWPKEKGDKPTSKLTNYDQNEGATTPVGRYPDGATPEGLHDMAGNVWEWMENEYEGIKDSRALRGGSWDDAAEYQCCSARYDTYPDFRDYAFGFRVVHPTVKT